MYYNEIKDFPNLKFLCSAKNVKIDFTRETTIYSLLAPLRYLFLTTLRSQLIDFSEFLTKIVFVSLFYVAMSAFFFVSLISSLMNMFLNKKNYKNFSMKSLSTQKFRSMIFFARLVFEYDLSS